MKTNWFISSEKETLPEARDLCCRLTAHLVDGVPLRFRYAIVAGPTDGFCVCHLGFALANELTLIR